MNQNIEIGKRIKLKREECGLTQEELGKAVDLNKSTIQRYETGKIEKIKLPVIQAIAQVLKVDPNWLILKCDYPLPSDPHAEAERPVVSDEDIKFALWGGAEGITDEMYEEVRQYAEMVKMREERKKE